MWKQWLYGLLAVSGFCWVSVHLVEFMQQTQGEFSFAGLSRFDWAQFIRDANANPAARFITADVSIGVLTLMLFAIVEGVRLRMRATPIYIGFIFLIGFAFAFPFFMLMRERALRRHEELRV